MSNRFHNKFHRHNHHTEPTDRDGQYPDSAYDPIASPDSPFRGEFYVDGNITTLSSISARKDFYASSALFHEDVEIEGNLTIRGNTTQLDTFVYVTSALDITNVGTGPALKVTQEGSQPIAHFIDSDGDDIVFNNNGYVGLGTMDPNEKLTVIGNISASGNTIIEGNSYLSGSSTINGNLLVDADTLFVDSINSIVGVGTIAPNEKLTIVGNISATGNTITQGNNYLSGSNLIDKDLLVDTDTLFVKSANHLIGIGTITPNEKLTVVGNVSSTGNIIAEGSSYLSGSSVIDGSLLVNTDTLFVGSISEVVGIGTIAPNEKLTVNGNISATGNAIVCGNSYLSGSSVVDGSLLVDTDTFFVDSANNIVGIGTTTPNQKLTVIGNISAAGNQVIDGYLTVGILSAGLTDQVIINNNNTLEYRQLNSQAWDTSAEFLSGRSLNVRYVPMYDGPNTLVNSPIDYDGNKTIINSNTTVTGSLTSLGDAYFANTLFTTTSSLSIVNTGPGPALYVYQSAGAYDVASFYDGDGVEVLHVGNSNPSGLGRVGINTSEPNAELTIIGSISATETIYASGGNSNEWGSVFTLVQSKSGSWDIAAAGGGYVGTDLKDLSANWQNTYYTVSALSASWNSGLMAGEYLPLSGGSVNGLVIFSTASAAAAPITILPTTGNDVELMGTVAVTITAFENGVKGSLYTITNKTTNHVTISASPTVIVRGGSSWRSNTHSMSAAFLTLPLSASCSLRADNNGLVSIW